MEPMAEAGPLGPQFTFSHFPEAPTELRYYVDELQTARIRHAEFVPNSLARHGMSGLEDRRELVADYINILSKLDTYEGSILSPQKLAELCAIQEQVTQFFDSHQTAWHSADNELTSVSLSDCLWINDLAPRTINEWGRLTTLREIVRDADSNKLRAINMSRYAARVWIDSFEEDDRAAAEYLVGSQFGELLDLEIHEMREHVDNAATPESAYVRKIQGIHRIPNHAFACYPMSVDEAWAVTDAIKTV